MMYLKWHVVGPRPANDLACEWLRTLDDQFRAINTIRSYQRALQRYFLYCDKYHIDPLEAKTIDILKYLRALRDYRFSSYGKGPLQPFAVNTIRLQFAALRIFFDYAIIRGARQANPIPKGQRKTKRGNLPPKRGLIPACRKEPWLPTRSDWFRILEAMCTRRLRDRAMFSLCYDSALRRSELCQIRLQDLNIDERQVRIRAETSKSGYGRTMPFTRITAELLTNYLEKRPETEDAALFLSESTRNYGAGLSNSTWSMIIRDTAQRARCDGFSTHTFRHMTLTELADAGWSLTSVADFAGHQSLESTISYIHRSGRALSDRFEGSIAQYHSARLADLVEPDNHTPYTARSIT